MSKTTFVNGTPIVPEWLNEVNDAVFEAIGDGTDAPTTPEEVRDNLDVPQRDGTDATGTWNIDISGNAATATAATNATNATNASNATGPAASDSVAGIVEKLNTTEAQAGVDDTRYHSAATMKSAQIQLGTPVTLTNQTSVDFTGIPSWAKRVTVLFSGVSSNGTDNFLIQLGDSGGIETSSYLGSGSGLDTAVATTGYSTGFGIRTANAANLLHGAIVLHKVDGNIWAAYGVLSASNIAFTLLTSGTKTLSATLDRVRLTTTGGTNQFDSGSINISWE